MNLETIEQVLNQTRPKVLDPAPFRRRAAVAAVLRARGADTEVLFIKRAQRPGDLFSGHMAFPGGHWEQDDDSLCATAIRETHEEIGLDLARHARRIGHLDYMDVTPVGRREPMLIAPYLFALDDALPQLRLNHEVAAVHWGSIGKMLAGKAGVEHGTRARAGIGSYPGYQIDSEIVWGFTYMMLQGFFRILAQTGKK